MKTEVLTFFENFEILNCKFFFTFFYFRILKIFENFRNFEIFEILIFFF